MSQLSFFDAQPTQLVAVAPTVHRTQRAVQYHLEQDGDYYHVWHGDTYLGFIYHIAQKVWSLFFPGERGVCGFGYKTQQKAAAALHECFIRREKGLEI